MKKNSFTPCEVDWTKSDLVTVAIYGKAPAACDQIVKKAVQMPELDVEYAYYRPDLECLGVVMHRVKGENDYAAKLRFLTATGAAFAMCFPHKCFYYERNKPYIVYQKKRVDDGPKPQAPWTERVKNFFVELFNA